MIVLHALWTETLLHVWGETPDRAIPNEVPPSEPRTPPHPGFASFTMPDEELRHIVGDLGDSLLAAGAASSRIRLLLPHRDGAPIPSVAGECALGSEHELLKPPLLTPCEVPTLAFAPADAVDLLTASPTFTTDEVRLGPSLRYWSRVAELVLELLARQRFVPAVHDAGADAYRGYWRVVVDDQDTSDRLQALIVSMPPVCRAVVTKGLPLQAAHLVETFLWKTVDGLVRRCLEGDELAHALHDQPDNGGSVLTRWLRSLVRPESTLTGTREERELIHDTVRDWLATLGPPAPERTCRTCFRLHPPAEDAEAPPNESPGLWRLTFHMRATQDPSLVLDATNLNRQRLDHPTILERPFDTAHEQLRTDLAHAARLFPPLAPCAEPKGPLECRLTLEEAYRFLRDAAPVLEAEGTTVWGPSWWRGNRPRLRMQLDIRPRELPSSTSAPAMRLDTLVAYDWRVALGDEDLSPEEITQLAKAKAPLVRLRGRWTETGSADLETAREFLEKNRSGEMTVFEALRRSYLADDLDPGLPIAPLRAHGWIERLLNATDVDERLEKLKQPAGFRGTLRPYQLNGLRWLSFLARHGLGACLADDMGLGKTIQLIALLLHEREAQKPSGPTLLIVPMSLVGNWQREISRFGPSLQVMIHHGLERLTGEEFVREAANYDVVVSTYGLVHRDLDHLSAVSWHRVALDEAQNTKNPAAKQSAAIRVLRTVHRVALTGTPVENRLSELWSIMEFLNPTYLGSARDFRRKFAVPIERYHDGDRAERLRHLIRPFMLRRHKDDPNVLDDLPDKLEMTVFCNLTREQAALYEAVVKDMMQQIDSSGGIQRRGLILAALVKLKQICNHPVHFLADDTSLPHRSGKCDRLTEMLEEVVAEDHRALIFTQFTRMGHLLQKHLRRTLDREVLFLHGGTPQKGRVNMIERFQSGGRDAPVFVLSLKAGGFGLNLTAANHVFLFDRWWNPAVEDQATDRAHRIGQKKQVQVHKFVCIGTLEESIADLLNKKRSLAEHVIGRGEDWITEFSTDKLRELFTLSRDAVAGE